MADRAWGIALVLVALVVSAAEATPAFPWTSFRAIAQEHSAGGQARCTSGNNSTEVAEFLIFRTPGFYRIWAMLAGREWVAVHYDGDARPDWVWRGTWTGDTLSVASVAAYDPAAHHSGCDLLFRPTR